LNQILEDLGKDRTTNVFNKVVDLVDKAKNRLEELSLDNTDTALQKYDSYIDREEEENI